MGVYRGLVLFKKSGGKVIKNSIFIPAILSIFPSTAQFYIQIRESDSLEEQLKSIIHELLHISYEYEDIMRNKNIRNARNINKFLKEFRHFHYNSELERKIEQETEVIYANQPSLVNYLRSYLN